ncbi:MAG: phosphoribosylformylglycinamidine synthase subunit PurQ [Bacteroidota bacterium]|nr:phosphoribosylformylglycinamidine synthase subunit PurQ [Candidatus Kapabacteria bacterium]MDW8219928.1 phosphoribosylformylglycinamidine synthase subunit PurQ [Bacteroidota bacterium]
MTVGVVTFPGSNCDRDALYAASLIEGVRPIALWHKDTSLPSTIDCIILPGGFSYGDYLRCGAIARFAPIMHEVVRFAERGGYVLGICNGFQILTEAGLLEGVLLRNTGLAFICKDVYLRVERTDTAFTSSISSGVIRMPIAHGDGNYFADESTVAALEDEGRVLFRYADEQGNITPEANPNGSLHNIAGIINKRGNVLGMMPHPERACDPILGKTDGRGILTSLYTAIHSATPYVPERSVHV